MAFVVGTPDRSTDRIATSIWVVSTDDPGGERPFTAGPEDTAPRWSPDGRSLAFVRGRAEEAQVHVAPLDGGEPRPVTAAPHGVSAPAWSPDSRRVAYVARTGDWKKPEDRSAVERSAPVVVRDLYNRFDAVGRFDDRRAHLFVSDLDGGAAQQVTDGDWDDADPCWSSDGTLLTFVSDRSATRRDVARRDVWVVAVDGTDPPRRLTDGNGTAAGPRFSPDGSTVSWVGHTHEPGNSAANTHLMVAATDGSAAARSLSAPLDRTVWGLLPAAGRAHAWTADGTGVVFLANDAGAQGIHLARTEAGDPPPVRLAGGDRQIMALSAGGDTIAFVAVWPSTPWELWCTTPDGSGERQVTAINARLAGEVALAPLERSRHRAADGTEIESLVMRPPGTQDGQPTPTVLEIHGGPHGWHPQASMMALYQSLAAAGYVVLLPNPRGSHGYGEDFAGRCVGDWGGADFEDLMGAVDALVDAGTADADRLFVGGYSYGGFMTTWTVGHTGRFRAACVAAPVADLTSMYATTDIPHFSQFECGGTPWARPDFYAAHSPLTHLPQVTTPVQVLHWEGDLRCPISQGEEVFQALRLLGKEAALVRYPGGFHVTRTPSQMEDYVQRHLDWFAAH